MDGTGHGVTGQVLDRPFAISAPTQLTVVAASSAKEIEDDLVQQIFAHKASTGNLPDLSYAMAGLSVAHCHLPDSRIAQGIRVYQHVRLSCFQTLQCYPVFAELLLEEGWIPETIATDIWLCWQSGASDIRSRTSNWLDSAHQRLGLGRLFSAPPSDEDFEETGSDSRTSADVIILAV